jgi:beta-lactamase regulating signal transducer with metallopeptidase domain
VNLAYLSPLANHLWQSTLFAGIAGLLTLALGNNRARVRHWVWLAASWKFLVPFSVLISLGGHIPWQTAPLTTQSNLSVVMDEVSQPFTLPAASSASMPATSPAASPTPALLWTIWVCGFLGLSCSWWIRWRRIRAVVRAGSTLHLEIPIRAVSSASLLEPGVFGVFRPVMLLPEGILNRLTAAQLKGVIVHELCHVYHRDNLVASIHMWVETVFWFHPLVWWIGKRMVEERERSCDEEVLRLGSEPRVYAEGILNVCKLYVESPLVCVAGVTGGNLKRRIEAIMANRVGQGLNRTKKLLLASAGIAALAGPIAIGLVCSPPTQAQILSSQAFEVASVKPT